MSRDLRLRQPEALVNVADAQLPCEQKTENSEPRRVAQRLKQGTDVVELAAHGHALTNVAPLGDRAGARNQQKAGACHGAVTPPRYTRGAKHIRETRYGHKRPEAPVRVPDDRSDVVDRRRRG